MFELMKSYHRTIDWHRRHDDAIVTQAPAAAHPTVDAAAAAADGSQGLFVYSPLTCHPAQ